MKHFILSQHPCFSERMHINGWQGRINPNWICFQDFYKIPRQSVLTADMGENVPFPDIVTAPFLLFSERIMDVAQMYGDPVYECDVVVINEQDRQSRHYHLVLLEDLGGRHILWEEGNLFYMNIKGKREIVVSLDFAESILRRGAVGTCLRELREKEVAR